MKRASTGVQIGLFLLAAAGIASADTFDSSETLQITFTSSASSGWNELSIGLGSNAVVNSTGTLTFSLYDGSNNLLGVDTTSLPFILDRSSGVFSGDFAANTTAFPLVNPTIIGFTAIRNGITNGTVDVTLSSGDITNVDLSCSSFQGVCVTPWELTNGSGGGIISTSSATLISSSSPVPEPQSVILLLTIIAFLAAVLRERRKNVLGL